MTSDRAHWLLRAMNRVWHADPNALDAVIVIFAALVTFGLVFLGLAIRMGVFA